LTAWDIPGLVHGFCGRTGGVSAGPFATFNLAGWVGDAPDAVAENWRRWHLLHPNLPVVRVRQVHGNLVHHIDSSPLDSVAIDSGSIDPSRVDSARPDSARFDAVRVDSSRIDSSKVDSARIISAPGDIHSKGDTRPADQRSAAGRPGGHEIEVVGPAHVGLEGDGMVTAAAGIALGIFTADCVPILMVDEERRIVAALHAGWRGTLAGIADAGVHAMVALGARPASIRAALGPSIGLCCFEVDAALAETFAREVPGTATHARLGGHLPHETPAPGNDPRAENYARETPAPDHPARPADSLGHAGREGAGVEGAIHEGTGLENVSVERTVRPGKAHLDLRAIIRLQLERGGLTPPSITNVGPCTRCANDLFFSRRGAGGVTSGLQMSFIAFAP
jgi:YfiH family protein